MYISFVCFQEAQEDQMDTNSAYILFYERDNTDFSEFMPDLEGKQPDLSEIDDEFESDFKKACVIQWEWLLCTSMLKYLWLDVVLWNPVIVCVLVLWVYLDRC